MRINSVNSSPQNGNTALIQVPRGLEGVVVSETQLGDVRGSEGFFHYRQYSAIELARKRSLEDVWYLLFEGALPDYRQSRAFKEELAELRQLDAEVAALLPGIAKVGEPWNPLDGLRTALSLACTARGLGPCHDLSPEQRRRDIHTQVEFYAGVLLEACGLPRPMFTSTFATSRVIGWCANILEQATDSHIIRPSAKYVGPAAPQPVPQPGPSEVRAGV